METICFKLDKKINSEFSWYPKPNQKIISFFWLVFSRSEINYLLLKFWKKDLNKVNHFSQNRIGKNILHQKRMWNLIQKQNVFNVIFKKF